MNKSSVNELFLHQLLSNKTTAAYRKSAKRIKETVFVPTQAGKDASNKLAEKVLRLPAGRLVKFMKRSARKASTAKYLLAKLHKDARFRPAVEQEQEQQLIAFSAAKMELEYRALPLKEKLAKCR